MDRPVMVGAHVRTRGFCTFAKAFFACFTAVCIVNAGSALGVGPGMCERIRSARNLRAYIHRSDGLEDGAFGRDHGEPCCLREMRGLERGGTLPVRLVRLVAHVSAIKARGKVNRCRCGRTRHMDDAHPAR